MTENKSFIGVIEKVINKKNKDNKDVYSFKIGDTYYSGFGICPADEGDTIEFEFVDNPGKDGTLFHNVKQVLNIKKTGVKLVSTAPDEMIGALAAKKHSRELMRMAVDLSLARNTITNEEVSALYEWLCKKIDG